MCILACSRRKLKLGSSEEEIKGYLANQGCVVTQVKSTVLKADYADDAQLRHMHVKFLL